MAYKYSTGGRKLDDITAETDTDADTKIDFEEDYMSFRTNGADVLVVSGSVVGIGTAAPDPDELLTIDGVSGNHEANIQFREDGANRAKVGINNSDNLVLHNQSINKHIVFKVNDQGVTREGLRVDGAAAAVVVNEGSESLVDFRVESDSETHMLFVDGGNNKIGVKTNQPEVAFDINDNAIRIRNSSTPSSASDFGVPGEIRWDANYIYVCVSIDTWKRVALSTW